MSRAKAAFVFVHGAWNNHTTWARVMPLVEAHGHVCLALDLPGAGVHAKAPRAYDRRPFNAAAFAVEPSPSAGVTQQQRTFAVVSVVAETARATNGPVVLVGHSLGGSTISAVAEAIPDQLSTVVYLTGAMPPPGMPPITLMQDPSMEGALLPSLVVADPKATGAFRINPRSDDASYLDLLRTAFFGDVSDADFTATLAGLHCDEPAQVLFEPTAISAENFGSVPRHYIRCSKDRATPISGQDFMIAAVDKAIGGSTHVHTLDTSHSPFLSQAEDLSGMLLAIAEGSVSTDRS